MRLVRGALALALCGAIGACAESSGTTGEIELFGAGATFPAPLYRQWFAEYTHLHPDVAVFYEEVGSGEGTALFLADQVDFGASDAALTEEEIASVERGVRLIPVTGSSVVLVYNLPGFEGALKLPREVYVDILLGEVTRWDDPRIAGANPGEEMPDLPISVCVRADGSGTTYAFTSHLSAISPKWRSGPGTGKSIDWPGLAMEARGNTGVAGLVRKTPGAIGYVSYGIAAAADMPRAALENRDGKFIGASGTSGTKTLANIPLDPHLRAFDPDPGGDGSYPIVTYTWLMLYREYDDEQVGKAVEDLVRWCLTDGQDYCEPLGYIRLAPEVVEKGRRALGV